ncbi:MAG: M16 family metallopeptidase, partial [Candidatus Brocadiales bacterium]
MRASHAEGRPASGTARTLHYFIKWGDMLVRMSILCFLAISWLLLQLQTTAAAQVELDLKEYRLKNGLVLLMHEDHSAPIISFQVWYHVGSINERPGITGISHLFEHMMFKGSKNVE